MAAAAVCARADPIFRSKRAWVARCAVSSEAAAARCRATNARGEAPVTGEPPVSVPEPWQTVFVSTATAVGSRSLSASRYEALCSSGRSRLSASRFVQPAVPVPLAVAVALWLVLWLALVRVSREVMAAVAAAAALSFVLVFVPIKDERCTDLTRVASVSVSAVELFSGDPSLLAMASVSFPSFSPTAVPSKCPLTASLYDGGAHSRLRNAAATAAAEGGGAAAAAVGCGAGGADGKADGGAVGEGTLSCCCSSVVRWGSWLPVVSKWG